MKKSNFKFSNPKLEYCNFKLNENFNIDEYAGMPIVFDTKINDIVKNNTEVKLFGKIGDDSVSSPFIIDICMCSSFNWDEKLKKTSVQDLLKINAPALLLSYSRPIISLLTSQAGLPAFNIPFMDFTENIHTEED